MKNRRNFIVHSSLFTAGILTSPILPSPSYNSVNHQDEIYLVGPKEGYSPLIGTLLSTMRMMRHWIVQQVKGLTQEQLDFQLDEQSNSIGAMLLHLAATEKYYQLNTFNNMPWGTWVEEISREWDIPMTLGQPARQLIKGHSIGYYLEKLKDIRTITEEEFAKRDDDWLMQSEPFFEGKLTNNYAKWFHVCEHESNHNGQIKLIKKRLPG